MSWNLIFVIRQTCSFHSLHAAAMSCLPHIFRVMKNYFYASTLHFPHFSCRKRWGRGGKKNVSIHKDGLHKKISFFIPSNVNWCEEINFPLSKEEDSLPRHGKKVSSDFFSSCRACDLHVNIHREEYHFIFLSAPYLYECLCCHNNNISSNSTFLWSRIFHAQYSIPASVNRAPKNKQTHLARLPTSAWWWHIRLDLRMIQWELRDRIHSNSKRQFERICEAEELSFPIFLRLNCRRLDFSSNCCDLKREQGLREFILKKYFDASSQVSEMYLKSMQEVKKA